MDEFPLRVFIHPLLVEELELIKNKIEDKLGYKLKGGLPIASKIAALELRKLRTKDKTNIVIEINKIRGEKKIEALFK